MDVAVPNFLTEQNEDGTIKATYKDGTRIDTGFRLEMPQAIVQTYFKLAFRNLREMKEDGDQADNRHFGLQSFLMSLLGVEAFLNVFFHIVGRQKNLPQVIDLANKSRVSIEHKISHLPNLAFGAHLPAQKRLNLQMRRLYNLRSELVHPKWQPSTLAMPGLFIGDLVDNIQQTFEDREFCRESLQWCLLVIARIGIAAQPEPNDHFITMWTTLRDTNASLSESLGIPAEGK
jgi:hypothetical protein